MELSKPGEILDDTSDSGAGRQAVGLGDRSALTPRPRISLCGTRRGTTLGSGGGKVARVTGIKDSQCSARNPHKLLKVFKEANRSLQYLQYAPVHRREHILWGTAFEAQVKLQSTRWVKQVQEADRRLQCALCAVSCLVHRRALYPSRGKAFLKGDIVPTW
ncbi:hypothetical protein WJX73_002732 [Symbiochloris irregularis]|uniref:LAGLIDADG homing endonuclease n=1 Tax=Symbiochloris irregularis TaxID=706552 RepID=A0AAW1PHR5_9CHLO